MSIYMCRIFHKRGKFSNAQLSFANFEIRRGADEVGFGRGPAETRVEGVITFVIVGARHRRRDMPPKKKGKEDDGKDAKGAKDAPTKAFTAPSAAHAAKSTMESV